MSKQPNPRCFSTTTKFDIVKEKKKTPGNQHNLSNVYTHIFVMYIYISERKKIKHCAQKSHAFQCQNSFRHQKNNRKTRKTQGALEPITYKQVREIEKITVTCTSEPRPACILKNLSHSSTYQCSSLKYTGTTFILRKANIQSGHIGDLPSCN